MLVVGGNGEHGLTFALALADCLGGVQGLLDQSWQVWEGLFNQTGHHQPCSPLLTHGHQTILAVGQSSQTQLAIVFGLETWLLGLAPMENCFAEGD